MSTSCQLPTHYSPQYLHTHREEEASSLRWLQEVRRNHQTPGRRPCHQELHREPPTQGEGSHRCCATAEREALLVLAALLAAHSRSLLSTTNTQHTIRRKDRPLQQRRATRTKSWTRAAKLRRTTKRPPVARGSEEGRARNRKVRTAAALRHLHLCSSWPTLCASLMSQPREPRLPRC